MKHTPGPWVISSIEDAPRTVKIGTGEGGWLGVAQAFGDTDEEARANAQLITAAPDLLAALCILEREMSAALTDGAYPEQHKAVANARAALAKAKGGGE